MKYAIIISLLTVAYFLLNKYYIEPINQLDNDETYIALEKEKVRESYSKSHEFEININKEKAKVWKTNENINIKSIDTNYSVGSHSIHLQWMHQEPVYVNSKNPKLETFVVPKSKAETKVLDINYIVVDK